MTARGGLVALALAGAFLGSPAASQDGHWPSFRGHRARGLAEGPAAPTEWNLADGTNVRWRTPIPGLAHSSPVIWGDRLFVTTAVRAGEEAKLSSLYGSPGYGAGESVEDEGPHAFRVYCLDKRTGQILWQRDATAGVPKVERHPKSSHASPTPACDTDRVVAFFGSEGLYCYDHEGTLLWKRDLGVLNSGAPGYDKGGYQWGFASSPVLHEGQVIVQCDVENDSFLAVFDATDGSDVWRTARDEGSTWGTPTVHETGAGGRAQVIVNGYQHIGGYDLATGASIWKLVGGGDVPVPTPVVAHDLVYITNAHGRLRPIYAVRVGAEGEVTMDPHDESMAWCYPRQGVYMQTPIVVGDLLYCCSDGGVLACYDAKTGGQKYRERLGGGGTGFSGSPVASGGHLYFTGESGEIFVIKEGPEFEPVATNDMGETCMATPAMSEGSLYIRTRHHVVAIGPTEDPDHNWPQWRGPRATGVAPHADPPVEWSESKNIRWKLPLPGRGHSTPIVWGDRVFLTTAIGYGEDLGPFPDTAPGAHDNALVTNHHEFKAIAVDRASGKIVWERTLNRALPHEGGHRTGTLASGSPVTDGEHLFAFFGSRGLSCLDLGGELVWKADLGQIDSKHGHGEAASPALHGDTLIVNWDHEGPSFLVAFDKRTGAERWRVPRDEPTSWATPIVVEHEGKPQVIVPGTNRLRGYDLATGEVIWECAGLSNNIVASPVAANGLVFAGSSYERQAMLAIRLDGARGDLTTSDQLVWMRRRRTPYVPSPLLYDDALYFFHHYQGVLSRVTASTGAEPNGPFRLGGIGNVYASPVGAAGRVYVADRAGTTIVLSHEDVPQTLAINRLDDSFSASPALVGRELFLRGEMFLYCIAEESVRPEAATEHHDSPRQRFH